MESLTEHVNSGLQLAAFEMYFLQETWFLDSKKMFSGRIVDKNAFKSNLI